LNSIFNLPKREYADTYTKNLIHADQDR